MKYLDDSTVVASLIIGVAIILSTFIYSIFDVGSSKQYRYTLIKGTNTPYNAIKIDHYTGEVWGIRANQQRKIKQIGE